MNADSLSRLPCDNCDYCTKREVRDQTLQVEVPEKGLTKHSRDVHGPRQKCPYCEFTYAISREDNLRRHIRIKHLSDSTTRSTMDSRVVIDTSSQGVTEDTELGSQSQLTERIDEGPLDLSIKVTNPSPPRETQTIAACTEDT